MGGTARQATFRPIRSSERCGYCRTCLNPKSKRACLTVRAEFERRKEQDEAIEYAKMWKGESREGTGDNLEAKLAPMVAEDGGLLKGHEENFLRLMEQSASLTSKRLVQLVPLLVKLMSKSEPKVKRALVKGGALRIAGTWIGLLLKAEYYTCPILVIKLILKTKPYITWEDLFQSKSLVENLKLAKKSSNEDVSKNALKLLKELKSLGKSEKPKASEEKKHKVNGKVNGKEKGNGDVAAAERKRKREEETAKKSKEETVKKSKEETEETEKKVEAKQQKVNGKEKGDGDVAKKRMQMPQRSDAARGGASTSAPSRKKKVSWKPDEYLCQVRYFQKDPWNRRGADRSNPGYQGSPEEEEVVEEVETPPLQQEWYEPAELRDVRMEMKVTPSMEEQRQRERVNAPHGPEATKGSPKEPIKPLTPEIQELLTQISKSGLPKMMHGGQPLPMQASASSSQPQMQVQSMAPPSSIVYTPTTGLPLPIISMPATTMPAPQQLPWQHQHQQQHQGAQYDQMCQFFRTKRGCVHGNRCMFRHY